MQENEVSFEFRRCLKKRSSYINEERDELHGVRVSFRKSRVRLRGNDVGEDTIQRAKVSKTFQPHGAANSLDGYRVSRSGSSTADDVTTVGSSIISSLEYPDVARALDSIVDSSAILGDGLDLLHHVLVHTVERVGGTQSLGELETGWNDVNDDDGLELEVGGCEEGAETDGSETGDEDGGRGRRGELVDHGSSSTVVAGEGMSVRSSAKEGKKGGTSTRECQSQKLCFERSTSFVEQGRTHPV